MARIAPYKYQYRYRSKETKSFWRLIRPDNVAELDKMEKRLHSAYVDFDMILESMHNGLVVHTSFAQYQATRLDSKSL